MKRWAFLALPALVAMAGPANAGKQPANAPAPAIFTALLDCRKITDAAARLACFDARAETLANATDQHAIVVTDREELRKTRRNLFGFTLPQTGLLAGNDDQDEEIKKFETTVVSGHHGRDGAWIVVLTAGGTWQQIDSRELALAPKAGQKVVITRGAMGTFFVSIDGQTPLRMRRIQ